MATTNNVPTDPVAPTAQRTWPKQTWPYWTAAVVGLLGLSWYFSGEHDGVQLTSAPATQTTETVGLGTPAITAAEVRMELYSSISAVRTALQSMSNPATVQTYLPQLREAADRLERVNGLVEQLSPAARRGMAASLAPTMRPLNQMFDRVLAMPDAGESARPTIDAVRSKLDALSRA